MFSVYYVLKNVEGKLRRAGRRAPGCLSRLQGGPLGEVARDRQERGSESSLEDLQGGAGVLLTERVEVIAGLVDAEESLQHL